MCTDSFVSCLSELDLSWNPQISPNQLNYLLSMNCLKALKCLRLRGCSTFQNISTNKQCPINLPVSTLEVSSLSWLNNNSSEVFMKNLEKFNTFKESSFGDQLLNSICSALIKVIFIFCELILCLFILFIGFEQ